MTNLEFTKFNVAQETVDLSILDKLRGQSRPDSRRPASSYACYESVICGHGLQGVEFFAS
jgi:hypothetical protein